MSTPFMFKREDLLAALIAKRPAAEKADNEALKQHQKDEQRYLKRFREELREALKWSYEQAQSHSFAITVHALEGEPRRRWQGDELDQPTCPRSLVNKLERAIARVEMSTQSRFRVTKGGDWGGFYECLTFDLPEQKGLC